MRTFTKLREMLLSHTELQRKIDPPPYSPFAKGGRGILEQKRLKHSGKQETFPWQMKLRKPSTPARRRGAALTGAGRRRPNMNPTGCGGSWISQKKSRSPRSERSGKSRGSLPDGEIIPCHPEVKQPLPVGEVS